MATGFDMGPPRLDQAGSTAADLLVHPGMGLSLADRLGRYQERAIHASPTLTMQARRTRSDFKLPMATPERSCSQSTVVARMLATAGRAPGIASCATGYRDIVTIPDIGHCVGSGAAPAADTVKTAQDGSSTGVCPACTGRFPLHPGGVISLHDAAEAREREAWGQTAQND